jgi:hypothetical protein
VLKTVSIATAVAVTGLVLLFGDVGAAVAFLKPSPSRGEHPLDKPLKELNTD